MISPISCTYQQRPGFGHEDQHRWLIPVAFCRLHLAGIKHQAQKVTTLIEENMRKIKEIYTLLPRAMKH
jgi:hypothetical protein